MNFKSVHSVGLHYIIISQFTVQKTKFANAQQATQIYQYKNIKRRHYKLN